MLKLAAGDVMGEAKPRRVGVPPLLQGADGTGRDQRELKPSECLITALTDCLGLQ